MDHLQHVAGGAGALPDERAVALEDAVAVHAAHAEVEAVGQEGSGEVDYLIEGLLGNHGNLSAFGGVAGYDEHDRAFVGGAAQ